MIVETTAMKTTIEIAKAITSNLDLDQTLHHEISQDLCYDGGSKKIAAHRIVGQIVYVRGRNQLKQEHCRDRNAGQYPRRQPALAAGGIHLSAQAQALANGVCELAQNFA